MSCYPFKEQLVFRFNFLTSLLIGSFVDWAYVQNTHLSARLELKPTRLIDTLIHSKIMVHSLIKKLKKGVPFRTLDSWVGSTWSDRTSLSPKRFVEDIRSLSPFDSSNHSVNRRGLLASEMEKHHTKELVTPESAGWEKWEPFCFWFLCFFYSRGLLGSIFVHN